MSGNIPETIPKLTALCEALGCHPVELLTPHWRNIYEGLLIDVERLVFEDDADFTDLENDKSRELRGWSRELLRWQKFFNAVGEDDDPETEPEVKTYDPLKDLVEPDDEQ